MRQARSPISFSTTTDAKRAGRGRSTDRTVGLSGLSSESKIPIMSPVSQRRVGIAFGLTPFVCAVLGFVLFPLLAWTHAGRTVDVFEGAIGSGVLTGIIGGMITGAIAHPTFERLMKR